VLSYFDPDKIPVDDAVFRQIFYSTPKAAQEIAEALPADQRARLALFCNLRGHLRAHARAIAGKCDVRLLSMIGGVAGEVLAEQARLLPVPSRSDLQRPPISLARVSPPGI
jgi:hypothetical protein